MMVREWHSLETIKNRWVDKEVVVHIHNGILLSYEKEHIWVSSDEIGRVQGGMAVDLSQFW